MTASPSKSAKTPGGGVEYTEVAIRAGAGAIAGLIVGFFVGGIGSRVAMRITAMMTEERFKGILTDADQRVGEITAGGTIFFVIIGTFAGAVGGVMYAVVRPWFIDFGPFKGLAFGLFLLAILGAALIDGDGRDFHLFGNPTLNIGMFAALLFAFGLFVAPVADVIDAKLPRRPAGSPSQNALIIPALAYGAFVLGVLASLIAAPGGFGVVPVSLLALPYALVVMPLTWVWIVRRTGRFEKLGDLRGDPQTLWAALFVLALPVVVGVALDVAAVRNIYEADF